MSVQRTDIELLLQIDQVHRPSREARKFIWSRPFRVAAETGTFFTRYPMDSDERMDLHEVATWFEAIGLVWSAGLVSEEAAFEWAPAAMYWALMGPVLLESRKQLDNDNLWVHFEALARAQAEAGAGSND